jgi:hypothetical protein
MNATKEQIAGSVRAIQAVAEAIRELGQVPAGTLYANICGSLDLQQFEKIISILVGAGLVKRDGSNLLTWQNPQTQNS